MDMLQKNKETSQTAGPVSAAFLKNHCVTLNSEKEDHLWCVFEQILVLCQKIHLKVGYVNLIANSPLKGFLIFSPQPTTTEPVSTRLISCRSPEGP